MSEYQINTFKEWKERQKTPEARFFEMWNGCEMILEEGGPNLIYLKKNGKKWFIQDLENKYLWCNYKIVWSVFEKEYNMNYEQIKAFIKNLLEIRLNLKEYTPLPANAPEFIH